MSARVLVTSEEAADQVFRSPSTVRWWASMGWIIAAGYDAHGRLLYDIQDIWNVERDRRRNPRGGRARDALARRQRAS